MRTFRKKLFLQKIKEKLPVLSKVKLCECKYTACLFSEWLEFEYGNYIYVFYHAKRWYEDKITYRKRYFDAFEHKQCGPIIIGDLYSGSKLKQFKKCTYILYGQNMPMSGETRKSA